MTCKILFIQVFTSQQLQILFRCESLSFFITNCVKRKSVIKKLVIKNKQ
jgi:hypothetical protein